MYPFSIDVGDLDLDNRVDVASANLVDGTRAGDNLYRFAWYRNVLFKDQLDFVPHSVSPTARKAYCIKTAE